MRSRSVAVACWSCMMAALLFACDDASSVRTPDAGPATMHDGGGAPTRDAGPRLDLPYATQVQRFAPGSGAGFGQDNLPDVVLGPPRPTQAGGSLDVLSLGVGGEIVLGFAPRILVDGPGPDLIVFENAFYIGGDRTRVYAEAGELAVSEDGERWHSFACDAPDKGNDPGAGCAGATPSEPFDPAQVQPLDPSITGGDAFDLADLGVERARFVRIVDRTHSASGQSAGFDLDAVGLMHFELLADDDDAGSAP